MFNKLNTLKPFFEDPQREFNVREAARILKIAPATASKRLKEFSKGSILIHRRERMLDLYRANQESTAYRDLKQYYNVAKIRESGIMDYFDRKYLKPAVIFFGSGVHGYDVRDSDFDFVVISEVSGTKDEDLSCIEKKLNRRIQVFVVKDLKDLKNNNLINNVISGMLLQGEMKWNWLTARARA